MAAHCVGKCDLVTVIKTQSVTRKARVNFSKEADISSLTFPLHLKGGLDRMSARGEKKPGARDRH